MTSGLDRVLIVGLGSIGRRHAQIARALLPSAQIAALRHRTSPDDTPAGVDCCLVGLDAALDFAPQAAVICSPPSRHLETAMALANASTHLLLEKPIAHATAGVGELIETCHRQGLTLMTGYNLRYSRSLGRFRSLLLAGEIGHVLSVRSEVGQYLPSWRPGTDYRAGVTAQASMGGGVLLELSHEIDYLRWIFGEVAWVNAVLLRQSRLEVDVEDTAHLTMGFRPPADRPALTVTLNMDFVRHDVTRTCTAIGEDGTLRWNGTTGSVESFGPAAGSWSVVFEDSNGRDGTYVAEWQDFLASIATGRLPAVSGRDGLAALEVIEAARKSSFTGSRVLMGSS